VTQDACKPVGPVAGRIDAAPGRPVLAHSSALSPRRSVARAIGVCAEHITLLAAVGESARVTP